MESMKEKLEKYATSWASKGCGDDGLLTGWKLFSAKCWLYSEGAKESVYSERVKDLIETSEKNMPDGWWDRFLNKRESCLYCGMTYKIENLTVCTNCHYLICHRCTYSNESRPSHPNGNKACSCGGEIVG